MYCSLHVKITPNQKTFFEVFCMFEITGGDIALLNDEDLRDLVGLLWASWTRGVGDLTVVF